MPDSHGRRAFLRAARDLSATGLAGMWPRQSDAQEAPATVRPQVCLTIDDPTVVGTMPWPDSNRRFLDVLARRRLKAAMFVCGMRVDRTEGRRLIGEWDEAGHLIGSHSYSHPMYLRRTSADVKCRIRFSSITGNSTQ